MKGERMAKRSSFGSTVRKRLSDITNSHSQQSQLIDIEENQQQQLPISTPTDELINQLLKEKMTLMKLVEERGKIVAMSNNQMRSLRMHYQKLQMQNCHLAQSNTQMLAELNSGREKVKALQHELVCKDALLKAKKLELEGKANITNQNTGSSVTCSQTEVGDCLPKASNNDVKPGKHLSRRQTARSQSMGPSTTSRQGMLVDKEKLENKRRCLRRQSARFKSHQRDPEENLFEIEDVTFSPITKQPENSIQGDGVVTLSNSSSSVIKEEEVCDRRNRRPSLGRPLRKAAEKVQSYKEVPLNVKMRREE